MLKHTKLVFYRIIHNKVFLTTYLILIPIVMGLAVYLTNNISYSMNIAIVGDMMTVEQEHVSYTFLDEEPNTSQLVLNQYDAVLIAKEGSVEVRSTKGEEFDQALPFIVNRQLEPMQDNEQERGTATNIIGFLMMVVSLLGVQIYSYYFDERDAINRRILSTAMTCPQYMLSHFLVVLGFLYIPAVTVITSAILLFDIPLAIPLWHFQGVLLLLCFFATAFGLWINSLSKTIEESMMFGNMFAIGASIVSGGFVAVTDNELFQNIVQFLPQKQLMSFLSALENHTELPALGILYIIVLSLILIVFAIHIEKKKLAYR